MCQLYFYYCCCLKKKLLTKFLKVYFYTNFELVIYFMDFTLNWRKEEFLHDKVISLSETVRCYCISSAIHEDAPITQQKMQKQRSTNK